jgi:hypothetical protein
MFVSSVSTIALLFPVAITLIIASKPVLSHFSSTVFALSPVKADVLFSSGDLFSSSVLAKIILKNHIISFIGLSVKKLVFHF